LILTVSTICADGGVPPEALVVAGPVLGIGSVLTAVAPPKQAVAVKQASRAGMTRSRFTQG